MVETKFIPVPRKQPSVLKVINRNTFIPFGTEVSLLGTERSSMEALILTCLQAQLIVGRINKQIMTPQQRNDLVWEVKQISPKECKLDAKVD